MSDYTHKSHNVTVLLYHLVFPAKYRRAVFDAQVDEVLHDVCLVIEDRYQLKFIEIGTDEDHVHSLVRAYRVVTHTSNTCPISGKKRGAATASDDSRWPSYWFWCKVGSQV